MAQTRFLRNIPLSYNVYFGWFLTSSLENILNSMREEMVHIDLDDFFYDDLLLFREEEFLRLSRRSLAISQTMTE